MQIYKQFGLYFYFSMFCAGIFSCQNKHETKTDKSGGAQENISVQNTDVETVSRVEAGKIKLANGKELVVPMFGDMDAITFYVLRHAEKAQDGTDNPNLTPEGIKRTERLGEILKGIRVDAIASTNKKRTVETAKILHHYVGAPPFQTYPIEAQHLWLDDVISVGGGRGYIVVGHSNTIPALLQTLGIEGGAHVQISDQDYSNLFILARKSNGKAEMVHVRFD